MWHSATSSRRARFGRGTGRCLAAALVLLGFPIATGAAGLVSVDEALASAFPNSRNDRETVFLTEAQLDQVEAATGQRPKSALVTRFTARNGSGVLGWAYLDTHRVRTLPETVMVLIDPEGKVLRIEVVAFREPLDYLPPESWYRQYQGRVLDRELELKRGIRPITGATLTARATTDAVKRVLAIHSTINKSEASP